MSASSTSQMGSEPTAETTESEAGKPSADKRIELVLEALEETHLSQTDEIHIRSNLPRQESERYNLGGEKLSRDLFGAIHGEENLDPNVDVKDPATVVKCTECGETWIVA